MDAGGRFNGFKIVDETDDDDMVQDEQFNIEKTEKRKGDDAPTKII